MKTGYQFIHFVGTKRRHSMWLCHNNRSDDDLGEVKRHAAWQQFCYFPVTQATYSAGCLRDIAHFIGQLAD